MGRGIDLATRKKITVPIYINEIPRCYKWGFLYKENGVFVSKRDLADCPFCAEHIVFRSNDTSRMPVSCIAMSSAAILLVHIIGRWNILMLSNFCTNVDQWYVNQITVFLRSIKTVPNTLNEHVFLKWLCVNWNLEKSLIKRWHSLYAGPSLHRSVAIYTYCCIEFWQIFLK